MIWTDEKIDELIALRAEGLTCIAIAKRWGTTKNTIIGKVNRLRGYNRRAP